MAIITQKKVVISGSNLSGNDGDTNRTYTIPYSNIVSDSLQIFSNKTLVSNSEYSLSSSTITFIVEMYDEAEIMLFFSTQSSSTDSGLTYTSVLGLLKYLHLTSAIESAGQETLELVGTGDNTTSTFFLDNIGVIEDTYTLYYGVAETSVTALVEDTDYTIDLDTSKITLTATGITTIGTNKIYAAYKYNTIGLLNSELSRTLKYAENYIERKTEQKFAEYTDTFPNYRQVKNEIYEGRFDARWKTFDMFYSPIVNFETTVNGAYTTGGTEIILTTAEGLPNTGTLYIGDNKVSYTGKSVNTLTIPVTTPSIDDGATVYGEVIEISKESEGSTPTYEVLERDVDYKIDFLQGRIELLGNAYFGEFQNSDRYYPANYIIKSSYMSAWYEAGENPTVPEDIEECAYMVASNRIMKSVVAKAHITGLNDFNPGLVAVDRTDIDEIIEYYKVLNVGTSPFNKSHIS